MALDPTGMMEQMDAEWAALDPDGYGASDQRETAKQKMLLGIATGIVNYLKSNAEVSFTATQITGVDSGGDTHDALSASGGIIE